MNLQASGLRSFHQGTDSEVLPMLLALHSPVAEPRILDVTANQGVMWRGTDYRPLRCDINPAVRPDVVANFMALPFAAGSFDVLVFDPPHLPSAAASAGSSKIWEARYGLTDDPARAGDHVGSLFAPFLAEARRVLTPGGIVLAKIADIVHNHRYQWQHVDFIQAAQEADMTACDLLVKAGPAAGALISSKWENVYHLRKAHCYWIVVRNSDRCECATNGLHRPPRSKAQQMGLFAEAVA